MTDSLYYILTEYQNILNELDLYVRNELTDDDIEDFNKRISINHEEFLTKADTYADIAARKRRKSAALLAEAARLTEWAKAEEKAADRLHSEIHKGMDLLGITKCELEHFRLSFRKSTSVDVLVEAKDLPKVYQRIKMVIEPDKTALKKALEAGEAIFGTELVTKQNLQVK